MKNKLHLLVLSSALLLGLAACGNNPTPTPAPSSETSTSSATTSSSEPSVDYAALAEAAYAQISGGYDAWASNGILLDQKLYVSAEIQGVEFVIEYVVSEEASAYLSVDGDTLVVNADATIHNLARALTINVKYSGTTYFTETINIRVVAAPELVQISALADPEMNKKQVQVRGVVATVLDRAYIVEDGTGAVLVYAALPEGIVKGDYIQVYANTSFYHGTICELAGSDSFPLSVKKLSGQAPETSVKNNPVALTGEGYAADVAPIEKGSGKEATVPNKWNLKFEYVTFTSTLFKSGNYNCFYPDDVEATHLNVKEDGTEEAEARPIETANYSAAVTGVELAAGVTYDIKGYLTWDTNYAYAALYVDEIAVAPTVVNSIELKAGTNKLYIQGETKGTLTIDAEIGGVNVADVKLAWSSSDETVATVADGVVTAVSAGEVTIKASYGEFEATIDLSVVAATDTITSLTLDAESLEFMAGLSRVLTPTIVASGEDYISDIEWLSSNTDVVTVENGVLTGVAAGSATITARTLGLDAEGQPVAATCQVTIVATSLGSDSAPLSVADLKGVAHMFCEQKNGEFADDKAVVKGVITDVKYGAKYSAGKYTITIADENDSTNTIKITGVDFEGSAQNLFVGDTIVVKHYLEYYNGWALYFKMDGDNKLYGEVLSCLARGTATLTISAEHATVTGVEAGEFVNGTEISFAVAVDDGFELVSVKLGGVTLEPDGTGNYNGVVGGPVSLVVTVKEAAAVVTSVTLDCETLSLPSSYADGTATVDGASFTTFQVANYGDGMQFRYKNSNASAFYNTTALPSKIKNVVLTFNAKQSATATLMYIAFGNASLAEVSEGTNVTFDGENFTYTITPDAETYDFIKVAHNKTSGALYIDSVVINYVTE